ncbi:MAG: hypothetical protein ACHREM_23755 [Polyangiales bacterium]
MRTNRKINDDHWPADDRAISVAALFVATGGSYFGLPGVDPWDVTRDARKYDGPHPVVAHPPCQLWVNFAALNFKRYGGEHNRPGNDGGCFASALAAVRAYGGVLEHPAFSNAWRSHDLVSPREIGWNLLPESAHIRREIRTNTRREWVCEVWQSAYGHPARKRTWLYYVGVDRPAELDWARAPGMSQIGWFDRIKPSLNKEQANATPIAFRDALLNLARTARSSGRAA